MGGIFKMQARFKLNKYLLISIFTISIINPCYGVSFRDDETTLSNQALEKIPDRYFFSHNIIDYAGKEFDFSEYEISKGDEIKEAIGAGWSAFNQNLGLQGAAFTVLEEVLSLAFLSNINNMLGEVGASLIIIQLGTDLFKKDFKATNINFAKGSVFYAIGKWGSKAIKLGAVGAIAVEWYLTKIADILYTKHDEFWYQALTYYFKKDDGKTALEALKITFEQQNVQTKEEILSIIDGFLANQVWNNIFEIEAAYRSATSGRAGTVRASMGRLEEIKEELNEYLKGVIIIPHLKPFFRKMVQENIDKYARHIINRYQDLITELNKVYKVSGYVNGPKELIKGLKVRIPGLVETFTDDNGRYEFRFTLYSLLKSNLAQNNKKSCLEIALEVPEDGKIKHFYRRGKIRKNHRNSGIIRVKRFMLESFYRRYCTLYLKIQDKMYSNINSKLRDSLKSSGQGLYENVEQCIITLTQREEEAKETWRSQGESQARIQEGVEALRTLYKKLITRSGCTKFYGAFCHMMEMGAKDAPPEVQSEIKRKINDCLDGIKKGCGKLPESIDW